MKLNWIKHVLTKFLIVYILAAANIIPLQAASETQWSDSELALLKMNWIGNLPPLPAVPSNIYADNPEAAKFGHQLFFDKRLSIDGNVSCATCHIPEKSFTDSLAKAKAIGITDRGTPTIIGIAYSPWFFWDGRSDSLWSQALSPLESDVEHGGNRSMYARVIYDDPIYRKQYHDLFGPLPDLQNTKRFPINADPSNDNVKSSQWNKMKEVDQLAITRVFVNIAKAIAAYQRLLIPSPSRFDNYVSALQESRPNNYLTDEEISGLKIFIGKAKCITCHQGPLFTNHAFHNVGAPDPASESIFSSFINLFRQKPSFDVGRFNGVQKVVNSEFNCLGIFSDASDDECAELKFVNTNYASTLGAFKVPTLRNIASTAPYFQIGQFAHLNDVLIHYNNAPNAPIGHSELTPLGLTSKELKELESFLQSLSSPPAVAAEWLSSPH